MRHVFALSLAAIVAGCVAGDRVPPHGLPVVGFRQLDAASTSGSEALRGLISNTTSVTPVTGGSRVEYLAPDGTLVSWLAGRTTAERGRWTVGTDRRGRGTVCRDLPRAGLSGCEAQGGGLATMWFETVRGDAFGLADGRPPVGYTPVPGWQSMARLVAATRGGT